MKADRLIVTIALILVEGTYEQRMLSNILMRMLSVRYGGNFPELKPGEDLVCELS